MCDRTALVHLRLPNDSTAPALARRVVNDVCCRVHRTDPRHEAELLVSEMVTNAFRYGAPPITLDVDCEADAGLLVKVGDTGAAPLTVRTPHPDAQSGRGLSLLHGFSDDWGVERTDAGKYVWFRLHPPATDPHLELDLGFEHDITRLDENVNSGSGNAVDAIPAARVATRHAMTSAPAVALALPAFDEGSPWPAVLAITVVFAAGSVVAAVLRAQRRSRPPRDDLDRP